MHLEWRTVAGRHVSREATTMMHVLKIAEILTANFEALDAKAEIEQVTPLDQLGELGLDPIELISLAPSELKERLAEFCTSELGQSGGEVNEAIDRMRSFQNG
jgi:hypothetical protein